MVTVGNPMTRPFCSLLALLAMLAMLALLAAGCAGQVDSPGSEVTIPDDCVLLDASSHKLAKRITDPCTYPLPESDLYRCGAPKGYMLLVIHDGEGTTLEWPAVPDANRTALEARAALCQDAQ